MDKCLARALRGNNDATGGQCEFRPGEYIKHWPQPAGKPLGIVQNTFQGGSFQHIVPLISISSVNKSTRGLLESASNATMSHIGSELCDAIVFVLSKGECVHNKIVDKSLKGFLLDSKAKCQIKV